MRPIQIEAIGEELAIRWDDHTESFIPLLKLRRHCPCAGCKGEVDVMGVLHKGPEIPLTPQSSILKRIDRIGTYALQPFWADGHNSGLFTFEYLRKVAER